MTQAVVVGAHVAEEKAWDEYWGGADGAEAVGGRQRHKLAAHWAGFFSEALRSTRPFPVIIDIAAGAGVALTAAVNAVEGAGLFIALDYSASAVASACKARVQFSGVAADAAKLPFSSGAADIVISQFGLEYAGSGAFDDAARILRSGGFLRAISHFSGGAIDAECALNERLLLAVRQTRLSDAARIALKESYGRRKRRDPAPTDLSAEADLSAALAAAGNLVRAAPTGAARATLERFLTDLARLCARRLAFEPAEALGWIDGMEASLGAYLKRMQSMRASALDRLGVDAIEAQFRAAGLTGFRAEPLYLDDNQPPAAWMIEARRPA